MEYLEYRLFPYIKLCMEVTALPRKPLMVRGGSDSHRPLHKCHTYLRPLTEAIRKLQPSVAWRRFLEPGFHT